MKRLKPHELNAIVAASANMTNVEIAHLFEVDPMTIKRVLRRLRDQGIRTPPRKPGRKKGKQYPVI